MGPDRVQTQPGRQGVAPVADGFRFLKLTPLALL